MAVEIIGNPKDVDKYRKYLHDQGVLTKRFLQHVKNSGHPVSQKPEGFRVFNTPIKKVFSESKKGIFEEDQKLFIKGIANENIIDRMDERLEPVGVDIRNFLKNRVLLLDHLYITSAVIGRVYELKPEDNGVHFEAYIGDPKEAPLTQQQKDARSLVAQKLVQTVSVGFIPQKIKAPIFDDEGKLEEPAVILAWELLELSVVAVPANPGAVFDLKDANTLNVMDTKDIPRLTNSKNTHKINIKKSEDSDGTTVQTLIFNKENFDKEEALAWAKENDYKAEKVEETDDDYKLVQRQEKDFEKSSFKTLEIDTGIKAKVGKLKSEITEEEEMEEKLIEILEGLKTLTTSLGVIGDSLKTLSEGNTTILSKLDAIEIIDAKGGDKEDEDEEKDEKGNDEKEDEDEDEDDMEEKILILADTVEKQQKSIDKITDKIDILSQSLVKILENSNG